MRVLVPSMACAIAFLALGACSPQLNEQLQKADTAFIIKIEKTPCFGKCPVYELTLRSDSTAHFVGKRFVQMEGEHQSQLGAQDMDSIRYILAHYNFDELDSVYNDSHVADLPSTFITVRLPDLDYEKKVWSRYQQPENLLKIQAFFERLRRRHFP